MAGNFAKRRKIREFSINYIIIEKNEIKDCKVRFCLFLKGGKQNLFS